MTGQKISVRVTFVSAKRGSNPNPRIESPIDITQHLSNIKIKDFVKLNNQIGILVEDVEYELYFHKDTTHKYEFDESLFPNGDIYGVHELWDIHNGNKKMTAKKLVALETESNFAKSVRTLAVKLYKRSGQNNRLKKLDGYIFDLCVLLVNEKI